MNSLPIPRFILNRILEEKRIIHQKYFRGLFASDSLYPFIADINPVFLCNAGCIFCYGHQLKSTKLKTHLSKSTIISLLDELKEIGIKKIIVAGDGEPTTYRHFSFLITEIKKRKFTGSLTTNGQILSSKKIFKPLERSKWDIITLSILGSNEKTHDYLVGKSRAFNAIKHFLNLFSNKNRTKNWNPTITSNTAVMQFNYRELEDIIQFGSENGLTCCNFEYVNVMDPSNDYLFVTNKEKLAIAVKKGQLAAKKLGIRTNIHGIIGQTEKNEKKKSLIEAKNVYTPRKLQIKKYLCKMPYDRIVIRPDSSISPCCNIHEAFDHYSTGKIIDHKNNPKLKKLKRSFLAGKFHPDCVRCSNWQIEKSIIPFGR